MVCSLPVMYYTPKIVVNYKIVNYYKIVNLNKKSENLGKI